MAQSDRTEIIRSITFKGTFTVREEVRSDPQPRKRPRRNKPERPRLGFRTDLPKPLPESPGEESSESAICCLPEPNRRNTIIL